MQGRKTENGSALVPTLKDESALMTFRGYKRGTPSLGELERQVMDHLWAQSPADAQRLHRQISDERSLSLSTVQSTVERLVRKGLLKRQKSGRAYTYRPVVSRQELTARMVSELVGSLAIRGGAISGIIDFANPVDAQTLDQLEAWIQQQRAQGDV